jgi:hypothetical protein
MLQKYELFTNQQKLWARNLRKTQKHLDDSSYLRIFAG